MLSSHTTCSHYQCYCMYVSQLEKVLKTVLQQERQQVLRMLPGPGSWIVREDAWHLAENFGPCKSLQLLLLAAKAAQFRVACIGSHFHCKHITAQQLRIRPRDSIFTRWQELKACMSGTRYGDRIFHWSSWYHGNHCKVLVENVWDLQRIGVIPMQMYEEITQQP